MSLTILLTAEIARQFGGRAFALICAAAAVIAAPSYLNDGAMLTTNCLEPLLWTGCAYFAILAAKRDEPRYWLWFGVVAGIGMQEKYSIAVFGFAIVVGLLLTDQRGVFQAGRPGSFSHLPAQPLVEHSLQFPVRPTHAQHQG
jgi:4-amino-4-deoxy-L-arabinose transferase-like glycosyltransferase